MVEKYKPDRFLCIPEKKYFLRRAGFPNLAAFYKRADSKLQNNILYVYNQGLQIISPALFHLTEKTVRLPAALIPEKFSRADYFSIFVSTLGSAFDEFINHLLESGNILNAFLLDAWGSEALETLNRRFDEQLRRQRGPGTKRFSPGYLNIDIRLNRWLIEELLQIQEIKVLESGLLVPRKSTVCLIGWFNEKKTF